MWPHFRRPGPLPQEVPGSLRSGVREEPIPLPERAAVRPRSPAPGPLAEPGTVVTLLEGEEAERRPPQAAGSDQLPLVPGRDSKAEPWGEETPQRLPHALCTPTLGKRDLAASVPTLPVLPIPSLPRRIQHVTCA